MEDHGTLGKSEPIVYIDHSDIRGGSLEELKAGSASWWSSSMPANLN
jgi:hypothetical protein